MFTGLKWAGWIFCVAVMTALCVGPSPQTAFAQDKVRDDAPAARRERPFRGDKDRPRFDRPKRDRRDHDPLPLTQEQIKQRLEIMRQLHPKFAERIEAALEENPEMAKRMLEKAGRRLAHFQHMRETDPQAFELEVQDRTLARESHELHRELQNPEVRNDPERRHNSATKSAGSSPNISKSDTRNASTSWPSWNSASRNCAINSSSAARKRTRSSKGVTRI